MADEQILSTYYLPRFGVEDEQQRIYLGKLLANIHAILEEILAVTPGPASAKYVLWDTPPGTLPNATKLVAGTNITIVNAPGTTTINGSASGVTSVALTAPAEFSVGGSPITSSGTLALTKAVQNANLVYAGPTTGSPAQPTFRSLVSADIPGLTPNAITALTGIVTATGPGSVASTLNIDSLTAKTTPVNADEFALADSAASFASKKITFANLQTAITAGVSTAPDFVIYTLSGGTL